MEEKRKIRINKKYILYILYGVICMFLFLWVMLVFVVDIMPTWLDTYFNPAQESVNERFIAEYQETGIGIYHDNVLNVTCYSTGVGLSCIPDTEIGRS